MKDFNWEEFKGGKVAVVFDNKKALEDFLKECDREGLKWGGGERLIDSIRFAYHSEEIYIRCFLANRLCYGRKETMESDWKVIKWEVEEVFKVGDRIKLIGDIDGLAPIGTKGTIIKIDGDDTACIEFEKGRGDKKWWARTNKIVHAEEVEGLNFLDVIDNIEEGQTWESIDNDSLKTIKMDNGNLYFDFVAGGNGVHTTKSLYALKKIEEAEEVTFEEAYKAYEEGKEIEDCAGTKYKKIDGVDCYKMEFEEEFSEKASEVDYWFGFEEIRGKWYINK